MKDDSIRVKVIDDSRRGRFVFRWTDNDGVPRQRTTRWQNKKTFRRHAEREAAELEEKLNEESVSECVTSYNAFELSYETNHLPSLALKSRLAWRTCNAHVRAIIQPIGLSDINANSMARMMATLRARKKPKSDEPALSEQSIKTYMATLKAALGWAVEMGYIESNPKVRMPKRAKGKTKRMRSRPITGEEFDRMIKETKSVRPLDSEKWEGLLNGLYLGGLRIGEALSLSWDFSSQFSIDLTAKHPMFRITCEGQKSSEDQLLPISPEFADWLAKVPAAKRKGLVFGITNRNDTSVKQISAIGKKARVVVTPDGKNATAHDLRRSFGTRWAMKVQPAVLQQLMRHASIETTMQYYVDLQAHDLAAELWKTKQVAQSVAPDTTKPKPKLSKST